MQASAVPQTHVTQATCSTCPLGTLRKHRVESKARVVTILEPAVRGRVDTAVNGTFATVHLEGAGDALDAVRRYSAHALLVSLRAIEEHHVRTIGRVVAECPSVLPVAVVTDRSSAASERLLQLGAEGVHQLLDLNDREGWCKLRCIVAEAGGEVSQRILQEVLSRLVNASPEARQFFATLIRSSPRITTVRELAAALNVRSSTLTSRFYRAGLPSAKRYLAGIRLLYAAAYLEAPKRSIAQVADLLGYSSAQSFGRHVQHMLGISAGELRRAYSFASVLEHHVNKLVVPFARKFRGFDPIKDRFAEGQSAALQTAA